MSSSVSYIEETKTQSPSFPNHDPSIFTEMSKTLNFNIGVLGHVDSGKTSLVRAISTVASTACFDKSPESKERGITLDLGFSSLMCQSPPPHITAAGYERLQLTLVDCPGHASLIRTIIGGAQIIDMMLLVIDVTKGIQTQTAECLVIGEIICTKMMVVINKLDLLDKSKRDQTVEKMMKKLRLTFQKTKFKDIEMIAVSAKPGGPEGSVEPEGMTGLVERLLDQTYLPARAGAGSSTVFSVDHCFSVKGSGTVMTGTMLQGTVKVGDVLEIPTIKTERKVKSIQMFRVGVSKIEQGDRAGICLTQFDPSLVERGVVCTPGTVPLLPALIAVIDRISFFKGDITSKSKFHISLGHETVMARVSLFTGVFDETLGGKLDLEQEYLHQDSLDHDTVTPPSHRHFALLEFERLVPVLPDCILIGSRLDTDINVNMCRLAFHGRVVWTPSDKENYLKSELPKLKVYKIKSKSGFVERASNEQEVIVRDLFKKETNVNLFSGLTAELSTGERGTIEGSFGQSGKVKVRVMEGLKQETLTRVGTGGKKKAEVKGEPVEVTLTFKKYVFDPSKKIMKV